MRNARGTKLKKPVERGVLPLKQARSLLAKNRQLHAILDELQHKIDQGNATHEELSEQIAAARACIPSGNEYASDKDLAMLCPEYCPPDAIHTAQKVFDIVELLETILLNLTVGQLLKAQLVSRQFNRTINNSVQLQRKLGFTLQSSPNFFSPFQCCDLRGLRIFVRLRAHQGSNPGKSSYGAKPEKGKEKSKEGEAYSAVVDITLDPKVRSLSDRFRRIPLVQPVITDATYWTECCDESGTSELTMSRDGGITIGDLADVAIEMGMKHRECPYAPGWQLDQDGSVWVRTSFRAEVPLRPDDPMVLADQAKRAKRSKEAERFMRAERQKMKEELESDIMDDFAAARLKGQSQDTPFPL